ncbi:hypothetical protein N7478_011232 [Penicillium angulare]|uniref:uncharacterized protein n=1 Tax=Penicillium angulare TaxID=116970 RepID=UPI002542495D|nr:uncharacterized protein N7478_011232 [Penicillium angulare]KAJ5263627.1 hypothetical protein N7478_011232 [Penicillium angulare]
MSEVHRDDSPETKRRKVRKGTQSCWDCKRRKVRCIFSSSTDSICSNCRRRRKPCISQEIPDGLVPPITENLVEARLDRLEKLIELAMTQNGTADAHDQLYEETSKLRSALAPVGTPQTPTQKETPSQQNTVRDQNLHRLSSGQRQLLPAPSIPRRQIVNKWEALTRELLAVWPSQEDLANLCTLPSGPTMRLNCGIFTSCPVMSGADLPTPQQLFILPPLGSHPILIARKFLLLGTFIHGIPLSHVRKLGNRGAYYLEMMDQLVEKATRLVTTNDELICSVEAIECIMMEAIYQNHAGNLHRSWMAVRRATAVAQMMAINRGFDSPSLKFLDPATRAIFDPDRICFRLVQMDRYLSIMLGLPPTSIKTQFATTKALEECSPMERLERVHCVVADNILRRSESDLNDLAKLHETDRLLQRVASDLPSQWWLPSFITDNSDDAKVLEDTVRVMNQFAHYHVLVRLHLPYMLRSSTDHRYDHSKVTAVNASREILSRYLAFRTSSPVHFYCRGDEFIAFISIIVMCIAHMSAGKQLNKSTEVPNDGTVFNFLAHSRPSDRGMMERTLEIIDSTARHSSDKITSKLGRIINHLLTIEANAASGTMYNTSSSQGNDGELECDGNLTDGGKALNIYIPYFGKINFESLSLKKSDSASLAHPGTELPPDPSANLPRPNQPVHSSGSKRELESQNTEALQFDQLHSTVMNELPVWNDNNLQSDQMYEQMNISETGEDWDLQGIDTALFDSLFRGADMTSLDTEEFWTQWAI